VTPSLDARGERHQIAREAVTNALEHGWTTEISVAVSVAAPGAGTIATCRRRSRRPRLGFARGADSA